MDITRRQITKIAREVSKFTARLMRGDGVGTAEVDFIHVVRKNPGITQAGIREILSLDKGAAARRAASLEAKGYLIRKENPDDRRSQLLYATEKADELKNSKAAIEATYYEWLWQALTEEEQRQFASLLDKAYARNKAESKENFSHVEPYVREKLGYGSDGAAVNGDGTENVPVDGVRADGVNADSIRADGIGADSIGADRRVKG